MTNPTHSSGGIMLFNNKTDVSNNMNDWTQPGFWEIRHPQNGPVAATSSWDDYWTLIVLPGGGENTNYSIQVAIKMLTTTFYVRYNNAGTWSAWKSITAT